MMLNAELTGLQSLQATNPAELRDVLPTVFNDPELGTLVSRLNQTEQTLATYKVDYSTNYPDVQRAQQMVDTFNQQISDWVNGIMDALANQLKNRRPRLTP